MLLVADIGNTNTVMGVYDNTRLLNRWSVQTSKERTPDEWGLAINSFTDLLGIDATTIDGAVLSSVAPPAGLPLERAIEKYFKVPPLVIGPGIRTGLSLRYDNPKEIGADRIVNSVAALHQFKTDCIVIDFGTATTYDCVTAKGEYLGGVICPGIEVSLDALISKTAKLPKVKMTPPQSVIGKTTVHALQSGAFNGYAAMVDGLVAKLQDEMGVEATTIGTGGLAATISEASQAIDYTVPDLTLEGLRLLYEMNKR